ncbi:hypothetical protein THAOC_05435, partial [Thalassiosira oceanica]
MQPSHTLFMQQAFIDECLPMGSSIRSKQIGHASLSGLSWPLAISCCRRFRSVEDSASAEPARAAAAASDMLRRERQAGPVSETASSPDHKADGRQDDNADDGRRASDIDVSAGLISDERRLALQKTTTTKAPALPSNGRRATSAARVRWDLFPMRGGDTWLSEDRVFQERAGSKAVAHCMRGSPALRAQSPPWMGAGEEPLNGTLAEQNGSIPSFEWRWRGSRPEVACRAAAAVFSGDVAGHCREDPPESSRRKGAEVQDEVRVDASPSANDPAAENYPSAGEAGDDRGSPRDRADGRSPTDLEASGARNLERAGGRRDRPGKVARGGDSTKTTGLAPRPVRTAIRAPRAPSWKGQTLGRTDHLDEALRGEGIVLRPVRQRAPGDVCSARSRSSRWPQPPSWRSTQVCVDCGAGWDKNWRDFVQMHPCERAG